MVTIAGSGAHRYSGDGGIPTAASLADPSALSLDSNGNLYIADYTNNVIRRVNLGASAPLSFPNTAAGQISAPQSVTLMNVGNQSVNLTALSISANFSQAQNSASDCSLSTTLISGAACQISVVFVPATAGNANGTLSVNMASRTTSTSVALQGFGIAAPVPILSLNKSTISFGSQTLNTSATAQSLVVSNTGSAPLYFSSITLDGLNTTDFTTSNTCGNVVGVGASCSVAIIFTPSALGTRNATLSLGTSSGGRVALTGIGVGIPQISLSPASLTFTSQPIGTSSVPQTIVVSNTGSGPMTITGVATSANTFGVNSNCQASIPAGASCSIAVTFTPKQVTSETGVLTLLGNFPAQQISALLNGAGSQPIQPWVWRPSNGTWYKIPRDGSSNVSASPWGVAGDIPVAGDYDGDGRMDFAVWRPSNATWYIVPSRTADPYSAPWGIPGDVPVPGDYDGDGKTDLAVWRPSNGTWYIVPSRTGAPYSAPWGISGDVPLPGDYDGDGKLDFAVWRPSNGTWWVVPSRTANPYKVQWGLPGDVPVPRDYDGDGRIDMAVWRPSEGNWYIVPSTTANPSVFRWGVSGDIPVPGDYDGDGKADFIVWRPSSGVWWVVPTTTYAPTTLQFGRQGDVPLTPKS
jgi:hypothetical protein